MRLLSLDYEPVYDDAALASFTGDDSVFDYDAVIWDPGRTFVDYTRFSDSRHQGLLSLSEGLSVRVQADTLRRRLEFDEFINSGRSMVSIVRPPLQCYVDSGQRTYSGTGRNRITTNLVRTFDLLSALPVKDVRFERASGTRIQLDGDGPITRLLQKYKKFLKYQAVMTNAPGTILARVSGTQRVISSMLRSTNGGYLILLPDLQFEMEESEEEEDFLPEAEQFQNDLLSAIEDLHGSKVVSRPAWAERYSTDEQQELHTKIARQQSVIEVARAELAGLQRAQEAADIKDQLFLGSGRALDLEVKKVLEILGGTVTEPEPGRDDWRVAFPEGDAVVEVKGVSKSAAEKHAAQLEKWVAGALEATGKSPKGILVVNTWRELPLEDRTHEDFPSQMIPYCRGRNHCLITGLQLFIVRAEVEATPSRAEYWRRTLLGTSGKVSGCDDWRSTIKTVEEEREDSSE
jgi:hypothetical protein